MLYNTIYLAYLTVPILVAAGPSGFALIVIPFIILFLVGALLVWRMNRIGFLIGIVMSFIFILNFGTFLPTALGNPSSSSEFFGVATVFPTLVATFLYSILGFRTLWRKGAKPGPRRTIPYSSTTALLILGFIFGALVVGLFAGATESRLLANVGKSAGIVIVQGAGTQGNPAGYYSPSTFTTELGPSGTVTVTWSNGDGATHTVTSTPGTQFDHTLNAGDTFSYTFTQAGTYQYYCTIHPWMKGTIVVTA
jgi:plastocyanin